MKIYNEKGVTLVALLVTIVILVILTSIGTTSGVHVIKYAKYLEFQKELEMIQVEVNELIAFLW